MTELKTLKDLVETKRTDGTPCEAWIPDVFTLKDEAIKWVKYYRDLGLDHEAVSLGRFFNITEEDLKCHKK